MERIDEGKKVWNYDHDGTLYVKSKWLYEKLREDFDFDVFVYGSTHSFFTLTGNYPKEKCLEIKKFIYENYPAVESVELKRFGIQVNFKTKMVYL